MNDKRVAGHSDFLCGREKIFEKAVELRHKLHSIAELSGQEKETKLTLMNFLRDNTNLKIVDRGLWFYAVYEAERAEKAEKAEKEAEKVAFRADFDAIGVCEKTDLPYRSQNPKAAHKCGHDGHSATLAAFAMIVDSEGSDKDIYFIFQNSEETGEGGEPASMLLEEEGIKRVFAVHNLPEKPLGVLGLIDGTVNCASKGLILQFHGISAHASEPEKGLNPSYAISKTVVEVDDFLRNRDFKGIAMATVVEIHVGERTFGVSAFEGELLYTLRGELEEEYEELESKVIELASKNAREGGLKLDISLEEPFPATINGKASVDFLRDLALSGGFEIYDMEEPIRASEDFGYYLKKAEGALVWVGAGESVMPLHSPDYDFNDELIPIVCKLFKLIARNCYDY